MASLVGSVFERKPSSTPSPVFSPTPSKTGFPQVAHRSKKSAFARAREAQQPSRDHVPVIVPSRSHTNEDPDDWRAQMSRDNQVRVDAMTDEEREEERREILAKFGPGIGDILKKVREARAKTAEESLNALGQSAAEPVDISGSLEEVPLDSSPRSSSPVHRGPLPPALFPPSSPSSRPASRASRKLRFAELTPNDVHVYESAPPSPRKKALALPPPSAAEDDVVSLGQWTGTVPAPEPATADAPEPEPEEGTPEYIRRRFFPSAPAHNPDLAWMEDLAPLPSAGAPASPALRFDLTGAPLAAPLHSSLPTHLGLHHHAPDADGVQRAGYTLDDVFMMSRSGVKAQRAAGMRMLIGVARWIGAVHRGDEDLADGALKVAEIAELKARVVAAGIEAMGERGGLGVHAIEVVWVCVVGWAENEEALDLDIDADLDGVELGTPDAALPTTHLLPQLVAAFQTQTESPADVSTSASLARLLAILRRLARQTNALAAEIVSTPGLVPALFRGFLLTGAPGSPGDALTLLTTLASVTRANAQALAAPADALLRFVTTLPPPDPALLAGTLTFYAVLASYGLYAHIASTAHLQLAAVAQYVGEHGSERLICAWARLVEAWTVCAVDPHRTTPSHEILWSQVRAWGWGTEVLALRHRIGVSMEDWGAWTALWRAEAAWLEGARVNGVRGGEAEREECVGAIKNGFESEGGQEHAVVKGALTAFASMLQDFGRGGVVKLRELGRCAEALMAAIRLWLACLPPATDGPLSSPPFSLPFAQLSDLCAKLVTHFLWSRVSTSGPGYVLFRPFSSLLASYLRLSQRLPDVSQDVWMAQALSILSRLLPGDEEFALQVTRQILDLITPQWTNARGVAVPQAMWDKGGLSVITPFLARAIQPREDVHIGPACMSPHSIQRATTQRLPAPAAAFSRDYGLPAPRDWTLSPLDHLLRSGTSPVFNSLPPSWDASEVDVTRAALLLTKISREVSSRFSFVDFVLTRDEAVFGCMKVFMLEHGQAQSDSTEEVYRDRVIGQLMDDILAPFTVSTSWSAPAPSSPVIPSPPLQPNLEQVAVGFLGGSTPFYQYYTDFVALYDAISFSHPTFARLLLPPTSMRYAVDYRRHLWNDFGHVLKSIRTTPADVIAADLGEYMWPVETDPQMLGAYLRALVKVPLQGFLRLVAMHHVACNIWPDLREDSVEPDALEAERAAKLLQVVVDQGAPEVVSEILRYHQTRERAVIVQPECFDLDEESRRRRLDYVGRVGGDAFARRVARVLQ